MSARSSTCSGPAVACAPRPARAHDVARAHRAHCAAAPSTPRCTRFASNFHINAAVSDSDGASSDGYGMVELYKRFWSWTADMDDEARDWLFARTAREFYRL